MMIYYSWAFLKFKSYDVPSLTRCKTSFNTTPTCFKKLKKSQKRLNYYPYRDYIIVIVFFFIYIYICILYINTPHYTIVIESCRSGKIYFSICFVATMNFNARVCNIIIFSKYTRYRGLMVNQFRSASYLMRVHMCFCIMPFV